MRGRTYVDIQLHVLPLAETSKLVTIGKRNGFKTNDTATGGKQTRFWSWKTINHSITPLYELLKDLSAEAVTDFNNVRLEKKKKHFMRGLEPL